MVKLHCDRCGAEIKDKYYTIGFSVYETNPKDDWATTACCATGYSSSRDGALSMLNAQKMYCSRCKQDIEKFISDC